MYEASADSYAEMMDQEINLPVYADVLSRLEARITSAPGTLIDTACGSGHMLALYHEHHDPTRSLLGIDLAPSMVAIARERLGASGEVLVGDMRDLSIVEPDSAAAVLNFFAVHHLDVEGLRRSLREWYRVLRAGGQLVIAAWEGEGMIDYGAESDIVALRYTSGALTSLAEEVGFSVTRCVVEPVEEFPMDAVYLEGTRG
jgi:ubiquinone/menaquinone biosynthesis C-methylase UbiE